MNSIQTKSVLFLILIFSCKEKFFQFLLIIFNLDNFLIFLDLKITKESLISNCEKNINLQKRNNISVLSTEVRFSTKKINKPFQFFLIEILHKNL